MCGTSWAPDLPRGLTPCVTEVSNHHAVHRNAYKTECQLQLQNKNKEMNACFDGHTKAGQKSPHSCRSTQPVKPDARPAALCRPPRRTCTENRTLIELVKSRRLHSTSFPYSGDPGQARLLTSLPEALAAMATTHRPGGTQKCQPVASCCHHRCCALDAYGLWQLTTLAAAAMALGFLTCSFS